jgi:hypothetical protein
VAKIFCLSSSRRFLSASFSSSTSASDSSSSEDHHESTLSSDDDDESYPSALLLTVDDRGRLGAGIEGERRSRSGGEGRMDGVAKGGASRGVSIAGDDNDGRSICSIADDSMDW